MPSYEKCAEILFLVAGFRFGCSIPIDAPAISAIKSYTVKKLSFIVHFSKSSVILYRVEKYIVTVFVDYKHKTLCHRGIE